LQLYGIIYFTLFIHSALTFTVAVVKHSSKGCHFFDPPGHTLFLIKTVPKQ